jgi:hypothetical protein
MQVYNPTEDVIIDHYLGLRKEIGPDEVKEFPDDCCYHLFRRQGTSGLVLLKYGMEEEEKYGSLKNCKLFKKIEGLKAAKTWTEHCLQQESMFKREVVQKNGGEVELASTQVPHFERKVKRLKDMISQAEKEYDAFLISKKSEAKEEVVEEPKIKRGRPFQKKEVINVDSVTT